MTADEAGWRNLRRSAAIVSEICATPRLRDGIIRAQQALR
jgi:hypothetical protein